MDSEPSEELNFWEWLLNPNAFPIIHDHLRQYLNVAELLSLSLTSKKLEPIRHYTLKKAANIDVLLKDYVQNVQLFRSYLRDANALISGSFALNVFEMGRLKVRKMDIFVEDGPMADHFMLLLDVWEQYESQTEQDDEQDDELPRTFKFTSKERKGLELRVTRTPGPPVQHIMASSPTTACVNFVSANKAYSIFPRPTFIQRQLAPLRSLDDELNARLKKLRQHGWSSRDVLWPGDHGGHGTLPQFTGLRRVGDSSTLVIQLDPITQFRIKRFPESAIDYSQFNIAMFDPVDSRADWSAQNRLPPTSLQNMIPPTAFIKVEGEAVRSPALCHSIVASDPVWESYLRGQLNFWAWNEWYRLDDDKRPEQDPDAVPFSSELVVPENFAFPASWDHADDEVPHWYREWKEGRMMIG
ncbi:hypothetical protein BKA56DRAFT_734470 [Ilyonectria sp. MPI-CAGE-AT-0026]|nr:hypothetical protein BKA56DRAFT_734470 [Ilyonectria sp. MPI-CAGE-AT-0026]